MKGFFYDTLLDKENICNLQKEQKALRKAIENRKKIVVFGPRNYGKTSVVRSVIIPEFRRKNKNAFVLFVDLMEVKSLDSIHRRIHASFTTSFAESFPEKHLFERAKEFLSGLRPQVSVDDKTGQPTLSLYTDFESEAIPFSDIFKTIREKIAPAIPTLVILDEFQDIALVDEAPGIMRNELQQFDQVPILLMGSKQHLLADMVAKPNAPLAFFGEDIEFGVIPYDDYHAYISERFSRRSITIGFDECVHLQDMMNRNPEAINILCAHVFETFENGTISGDDIQKSLVAIVQKRQSRYEEYLSQFSENQQLVLKAITKENGVVKHPTGKDFLRRLPLTPRAVMSNIDYLVDRSVLVKDKNGYTMSDPLLRWYLALHRF